MTGASTRGDAAGNQAGSRASRPATATQQVRRMLGAKIRTLLNQRRRGGGARRMVVLGLGGLALALGIFFGADWFLDRVADVGGSIEAIVTRRLLSMVMVFLFSVATFSNLIASFSTYYLADDLQLLMAKPIGARALYVARFVENAWNASWMTVAFSLPLFAAFGQRPDAGVGYWVALPFVLLALVTIPCALATVLSLLLTFPFSARRAKQVLVFLGTGLAAGGFLLLRGLAPERFLNDEARVEMVEALRRLRGSEPPWLPSSWATESLWSGLEGHFAEALLPLAELAGAALATFAVAGWLFSRLHRRAYSRAREGLDLREELGERRRGGGGKSLEQLRAQRARRRGRAKLPSALRAKDLRTLVRDTTQWSQGLLVIALIALYVVNFRFIRGVGDTGIITRTGLHFVNLALAGFVAVAICARFGFPAISLEGRAFWLVLRAPHSLRHVLHAKWRSMRWPLIALVETLVLAASVALGQSLWLSAVAALVTGSLASGALGLALGVGAHHPRFDVDNASAIVTGFGGFVFMGLGVTLALVTVAASVYPTWLASNWFEHGYPSTGRQIAWASVSGLICLGLPWLAARLSLRSGARSLLRRGI